MGYDEIRDERAAHFKSAKPENPNREELRDFESRLSDERFFMSRIETAKEMLKMAYEGPIPSYDSALRGLDNLETLLLKLKRFAAINPDIQKVHEALKLEVTKFAAIYREEQEASGPYDPEKFRGAAEQIDTLLKKMYEILERVDDENMRPKS